MSKQKIQQLRQQVEELSTTNDKLTKENIELRKQTNRCIAWGLCMNKAHGDSRVCMTHKCEVKSCVESKRYSYLTCKLASRYCKLHDSFWKRHF
jgi:hypothetical protein